MALRKKKKKEKKTRRWRTYGMWVALCYYLMAFFRALPLLNPTLPFFSYSGGRSRGEFFALGGLKWQKNGDPKICGDPEILATLTFLATLKFVATLKL